MKKPKQALYVDVDQDLYDWMQLQKYQTDQPLSFIINFMIADCRERKSFKIPQRKLHAVMQVANREKMKQRILERLHVSGLKKR